MSVKIKVSYQTEEELAGVIRLLSPVVISCKVAKEKKGLYNRAYIVVELQGNDEKMKYGMISIKRK